MTNPDPKPLPSLPKKTSSTGSATKVLLGISAGGLVLVAGLYVLAGDNLRALTGASADALSGNQARGVFSADGASHEGHKSLKSFSSKSEEGFHHQPLRPFPHSTKAKTAPRLFAPASTAAPEPAKLGWRPTAPSRATAAPLPWAGRLTAKEWRDVDAWDAWRKLVGSGPTQQQGRFASVAQNWRLSTEGRITVSLHSKQGGSPLADMPVLLEDSENHSVWSARTNAKGIAYLYPNGLTRHFGALKISFPAASQRTERRVQPGTTVAFALDAAAVPPSQGDVMLVMDTTGSMGDELRYFQSELINVLTRADHELAQSVKLRLSVNFYKDVADSYAVRSFPFTPDLNVASGQLAAQSAGGGGDYPEAVDLALQDAIEGHQWAERARGRILFLVLDAPPHHDPENIKRLQTQVLAAARRGIRIVPVAGSGINKETEFFLRHLAVLTGGTYVYLTDDSGVGGGHVEATGGHAQTERLNTLLTRLVVETMQPQGHRPSSFEARR